MNKQNATPNDKRHRFPLTIIAHAVWLYFRFALSYRDGEDLLAARGVIRTDETVRQWCRTFGQQYANALRRRRPRPGDKWHLDEVFITLNGVTHSLWRAVDQDGHVLDLVVQSRRNTAAAKTFFRRLRKELASVPRVVITAIAGQRWRGPACSLAARRAPPTQRTREPGGACPPAHQGAGTTHEPLHVARPRPALPRRLRADRQPLPSPPPPSDRRRLSRDPRRALRYLARDHGHPGDGLSGRSTRAKSAPRPSKPDIAGLS